jgi:hypothetical protein
MFKKAYILLTILLVSNLGFAQYDDDAEAIKRDSTAAKKSPLFSGKLKDKVFPGAEFMVTLNNAAAFVELSPFAGLEIGKHFYTGAGLHGSFLNVATTAGNRNGFYYGANAFGRVVIGDMFFLHAEMRLTNGIVNLSTKNRVWVSSPVYGIGFGMGGGLGSWMLLGYAPNINYAEINPFGHLVYRFGVRF